MAGAVDLGALKARNEAAARAAEAPAPAAGQYVVEVSEARLQADVLDRSFQVPVLLLLTSTRLPSDELGPVLEKIVNQQAGGLVLGRVDVDQNMRIAQQLQVQGVPAVFAVIAGQVIPGFQGNLPEAQVSEFVAAVLQAGREQGLGGGAPTPAGDDPNAPATPASPAAPEPPDDPRFTAAEAALDAGDFSRAAEGYQAILADEPTNSEARLALGQVRLLQRLESVDRDAAARAEAAPADVDAQLAAADVSIAAGDVQGALDRLVRTVSAVAGDDRERLRTRLLEFFDLLGPDDPRVPPARRALTRALF